MAASEKRRAIVLLHGIGDQRQRDALDQFLAALGRVGEAAPVPVPEKILREPPSAMGSAGYFLARTELGGRPLTVAEFYWADISRVQRGLFSILRNFFQLIVDAPDIIYACLGPRLVGDRPRDFILLRCMRALLAIMMWLIYFPIVALNLAYAILVGEFAVNAARNPQVSLSTPADLPFAFVAGAATAVMIYLVWRGGFGGTFRAILVLAACVLMGVFGFAMSNYFVVGDSATYGQYATFFNEALNALWALVTAISLVYLIVLPLLCLLFFRRWRSILLGFTTAFLVIRFWLALITTLWLVYLTSIFDNETYDRLISNIGGPIRFVSLMWFDVMVIGLVLGASLLAYVLRSRNAGDQVTGQRYPRLIIPSALPFVAMALAVGGVLVIGACNCALFMEGCEPLTCGFVYRPSEWIIANAATLLAIGGFLIQMAHSRFDVAIDIVNFFKSDRGHRRANPLGAVASVFRFAPDSVFQFRPRLRDRLGDVLADLDAADGGHERVTLIGHSLGSIIAIDWLDGKAAGGQTGTTELVTMGSPYGAIFHHYFPHMFAAPARGLLAGVTRWTNIYREDDYVGTALAGADIEDVVLPPKGHDGYFGDDKVVREILGRLDP